MSRVVAGRRAVAEALKGGRPDELYVATGTRRTLLEILELARERGVRIQERSRTELDEICPEIPHQGVVAILHDYAYWELDDILELLRHKPKRSTALLLALDELSDPQNVGAIVRSAVAFGADGVLLPRHRSAHITPAVVRASAGATEHARIAVVTNLQKTLQALSEEGLQVVGLTGNGDYPLRSLPDAPYGRVLVVGSEGKGLRRMVRERCDVLARIDIPGAIESLNASVAAGIALYALSTSASGVSSWPAPSPSEPSSADADR